MKIQFIRLTRAIAIISVFFGWPGCSRRIEQERLNPLPLVAASVLPKNNQNSEVFLALKEARNSKILNLITWYVTPDLLLWCVLHESAQGEAIGSPPSSLSIFNSQGKVLAHYPNVKLVSTSQSYLLRNDTAQLLLHLSNEGHVKKLLVLEYQNNEVKSLLENGAYTVDAEVRQITQEGVNSVNVPDAIILTDGSVPSKPEEAVSKIYLFHDGKYQIAREIPRKEMDKPLALLLQKKR